MIYSMSSRTSRLPDVSLVPRFIEPLPNHDDVSLDLVEATIWRLLAGRNLKRAGSDVVWLLALVQRYAEAFSARLARDGVSSGVRLALHRELAGAPVSTNGTAGLSLASDPDRVPTAAELALVSSQLATAFQLVDEEDKPDTTTTEPDTMAKTCSACHTPKPRTDFYASNTHKDGRRSQCKDCSRAARADARAQLNRVRAEARAQRILGE